MKDIRRKYILMVDFLKFISNNKICNGVTAKLYPNWNVYISLNNHIFKTSYMSIFEYYEAICNLECNFRRWLLKFED